MKTVRDIVSKLEMDATFHKQHSNILIDQALKEIEELLLDSLPTNKEVKDFDKGLYDSRTIASKKIVLRNIHNIGYNQALEDTRKAIKLAIGGK